MSSAAALLFEGKVELRSSAPVRTAGPPGESEIQLLNPNRVALIIQVTGWPQIAPGSLNLLVPEGVLTQLGRLRPILEESATTIRYPAPYSHIPRIRRAYWYFRGIARAHAGQEDVLVRRAENPVPGKVELFAARSLKESLGLTVNDPVTVEVFAPFR
jgi:hypothetical protein